jgi:GH15 family glucan-1,4-alpha-glucosidase
MERQRLLHRRGLAPTISGRVIRPNKSTSPNNVPAPAIKDYGLIGDCRCAALVSADGAIDWLCFPNFSSPSLFGRILDSEIGGTFSLRPQEPFSATRRYLENTAVLETTFKTPSGRARLLDFFPIETEGRLAPMRELVRMVEGIEGEVTLALRCEPRPDYARGDVIPRRRGQLGWAYAWSNALLTVNAESRLTREGRALVGIIHVVAGARASVRLTYDEGDIAVLPADDEAVEQLDRTVAWWRSWSEVCRHHGPWRNEVIRSAITLKLLTYCLSGGVVAAATTSLPEVIGGIRNWDYRFCWLRDAGLTMRALVRLGYMDEAGAFLSWMLHTTRLTWPRLQVVYDIYGRTSLSERVLGHLAGHRNSRPVRIGNQASEQHQLDLYGEVILAAEAFTAGGGVLDDKEKRMLAGLGSTVLKLWRKSDYGIWEIQGQPRHYTFSKLMCLENV